MYSKIVVPVDLAHTDKLDKALSTAADLARHYGATTTLLGITGTAPGSVAHNPEEFQRKLRTFANDKGSALNTTFDVHVGISHDPAVDLEKTMNEATHELGGDLLVMASHVPSFRDHLIKSHTGYLATHTDLSVFIVR